MRTRTGQFSAVAKWLHWLVVFFVFSIMLEAFAFKWTPPADRATAIPAHVSVGIVLVTLTFIRIAVRSIKAPPPHPPGLPGWMRTGASIGHALLYALPLSMAALGIWMAAISPVDIRVFSGLNLSSLAPENPALLAALRPWHFAGAVTFVLVLVGHVSAALWHHFKLNDDVLTRMLPFSGHIQRVLNSGRMPAWRTPSANGVDWHNKQTWFTDQN